MADTSTMDWSDCVAAVEEAARRLGESPTVADYRELGIEPDVSHFYNLGGGFAEAKREADLEVHTEFRHSVNSDYFNVIDSEEKAYWLGFLYGDGFISHRDDGGDAVAVELNERDEAHLRKLKSALDAEHSIGRRRDEVALSVYDDALAQNLREKGCDESKTHSDSLPPLDGEYRRSFVRGLVDADGTYDRWEDTGTVKRVSIAGSNTRRFEKLADWLPVEAEIYDTGDGRVYLRVTGKEPAADFIEWMYPQGDSTEPALERKVP